MMKKSLGLIFASVCLICGLSLAASAQTRSPNINQRERHQQKRIYNGAHSGELTGREFARLEKEQAQIQRMERRAKSDGELTAKERARLQHELNQSSRHIYRQKHDEQDRDKKPIP